MLGLGTWELVIIFAIVLVLFGPKALPKLGKSIGSGIRELKCAINNEEKKEDEDSSNKDKDGQTAKEPEIREDVPKS